VRESLRRSLSFNGYSVQLAQDGVEALDLIADDRPDAVVLDVMMPRLDGLEVCRQLRSTGDDLPILVLTARDSVSERVAGLDAGADDYLVKPFSPRELVARVRAILRRAGDSTEPPADLLVVDAGRLEVDVAAHEARLGGIPVPLTVAEFRLLAALARQPRRVFSRFELLQAVQGPDVEGIERTVDVHVMRLRRKMDEVLPGSSDYVTTVYGVGYRLDEPA
jgi:two-component system response regulator MprA